MSIFGVTIPANAGAVTLVVMFVVAILTGVLVPRWLVNRMLLEKDSIIKHLTDRLEETKVMQPLMVKLLDALTKQPSKKEGDDE